MVSMDHAPPSSRESTVTFFSVSVRTKRLAFDGDFGSFGRLARLPSGGTLKNPAEGSGMEPLSSDRIRVAWRLDESQRGLTWKRLLRSVAETGVSSRPGAD